MISTIAATAEVDVTYPILESYAMGDGFIVLSEKGIIESFNWKGMRISSNEISQNIVASDSKESFLTISSSKGDVFLISDNSEKKILSGVKCNAICLSEKFIILSTEDGDLISIDKQGGERASVNIGDTTIMRISDDHDQIVVATDEGKMTVFNNDLEILNSSPPAKDDIEMVTNISPIVGGRFLVSRESLGTVIDDRPVNRLEFWHVKEGLLELVEIPSRATCIRDSGDGYYVGCFEGELLWIERGKDPTLLTNLGYSITDLRIWEGDILASCWFYARRISPEGIEKWIFEHPTIISKILSLGQGTIALVSDKDSSGSGSLISLIDPNKETHDEEKYHAQSTQISDLSDKSFSGMPSENEIAKAAERNSVNEIDSIIRDINQSLELSMTELSDDEDILETLSRSASSINLPPVADAGDDMTVTSNEDLKADVILDGSKSYDPDGEIVSWSWISETGRVLGDGPVIKVRLSQGVHSFSLSVVDNKGAKSISKMTVRVV